MFYPNPIVLRPFMFYLYLNIKKNFMTLKHISKLMRKFCFSPSHAKFTSRVSKTTEAAAAAAKTTVAIG